jgi:hypothetical protein
MRALIHTVAENKQADASAQKSVNPILARLKRACLLNKDADGKKAGELAREILNDWDAITAFVHDPALPPSRVDGWRGDRRWRGLSVVRRLSPVPVSQFAP